MSEIDDVLPEPVPNVEIVGEGIEKEPSGLDYLLNVRLASKKGLRRAKRVSFFLRSLQQDGRALKVRAAPTAGGEWIKVKPAEVEMVENERSFKLIFGPFDSPGLMEGSLVLGIAFADSSTWITRTILVRADVRGKAAHPRYLPGWWEIPAALACAVSLIAASVLVYVNTSRRPRVIRAAGEPLSAAPKPNPVPAIPAMAPPTTFVPSSGRPLSSEVSKIRETLLVRGAFLTAREGLTKLWAAHPGNREVAALISKLTDPLTLRADLIPSPGQGEKRHGGLAVIASGQGFKLEFTPSDNCYLYVYHVDSHKNVLQLFPNSIAGKEGNPLHGGRTYLAPDDYFILDNNPGPETVYFVASRLPAKDLEDSYARFIAASADEKRAACLDELTERIELRRRAMNAGMHGCLFLERTFWHGKQGE